MRIAMPLSWLHTKKTAQGCLGIELNHGRAWAVHRTDRGVISSYLPSEDDDGLASLGEWIKDHKLTGIPVVVCLDSTRYELQLVESPPVPAEELSDAMGFRLAELVSDDISDKVLQAFPLPSDAYRGRMTMAFAAITERSYLKEIVTFCREYELKLDQIIINEMSALNLLASVDPDDSVAVLRLEADAGVIYLYRNGALYFTRQISLGTDDLGLSSLNVSEGGMMMQPNSRIDVLALELQRSMDYFESQLGLGAIGQLWVMKPDNIDVTDALGEIEDRINTPVRLMSLESAFNRQEGEIPLTASLAMALGGALGYDLGN
jgi:MSHA biogenesis protein MshI